MIEFPLRPRIDVCHDWEFVRGKVNRAWLFGRGQQGEPVDLPHCWNLDDTYQYDRKSYQGFGAYRRRVDLPPAPRGSILHLCSEGFYGTGDLWLDGRRLARIDGQYLGFDIALPNPLASARHILAIRLDNRYHRNSLPGKRHPDFLLYGGLVGRVWVELRPTNGFDAHGMVINGVPGPEDSELVELSARIGGPSASTADLQMSWTMSDENGSVVAEVPRTSATPGDHTYSTQIAEPRCWSPNHPYLYWAECRLEDETGVVDEIRIRFGLTRAEFRPRQGLFLNGTRIDLHGVNRHESIPGLGSALPPELHRSDARLLKRYGCNFVRLSHYPQHPAFLDACDELGIMVYAELASWKSVRSSRGWRRAARRQFGDLIVRDRHHPSVIVWGMGNESRSRRAYLELRQIARDLDPARPVTYAENHLYRARRHKIIGIPDIWSTNYELDVLDEARDSSRLEVVFLSECCNHPTSVRGDELEELKQVAVLEREWEIMADRPYLAGHAVWSFADYATEHRDRIRRQNGLFDAWRRPKIAAELFRARYAFEPFLSLFCVGSRLDAPASRFRTELPDPRGEGSPDRLHLFSNCDGVLLFQDGRKLASLEKTLHAIIPIDLSGGEVVADGLARGRTITARLRPHGPASQIAITPTEPPAPCGAISALDIRVVDEAGVTVRSWNGHLGASASGGALAHTYSVDRKVLITRGEGRLHVAVNPTPDEPSVSFEGPGLTPTRFSLVSG